MSDRLHQVAVARRGRGADRPWPFCGQWPVAKRGFAPPVVILKTDESAFVNVAVVTAVGRTVGWGGAHGTNAPGAADHHTGHGRFTLAKGYRDYVSRRGERSAELR